MIPLFHPYIPKLAIDRVTEVLSGKNITQGAVTDEFEAALKQKFRIAYPVTVNSGTAALETAYDLIGLGKGDEAISTPLTCIATNMPLLARGVKIIWADICKDTLCIDRDDVARKVTPNTKAIVQVHLGGISAGMQSFKIDDRRIPIVSDACQSLGIFIGDYTCCSFQAIKHITTGDGGLVTCPDPRTYENAKLMRWFGIDRTKKGGDDYKYRLISLEPKFIGYKRHMNDIDATLGLYGLEVYEEIMLHRKELFETYRLFLPQEVKIIDGDNNTHWTITVLVERRDEFARMLKCNHIETGVLHIRNDVYQLFGGQRADLPVLNDIEDKYISLPLHMLLTVDDVKNICGIIKRGW